ncbi:hypothetical protein PF005_g3342 [Phytophthora fragariae]|uniref:Uncharacterized protein n=1 Tax=Phytophthora fragariae TaxID=53985 RepID=A0A6A3FM25_9STRA|nr:hypothetical protein PF003_g15262 [Phytophthora fragariae]KAE8946799.1 hypothetical protein PF009_g3559 [Phytophthora fragariae]KAE9026058.1 hypothetical protein PF011_g2755 [Phytophthora fragariae]KAE9133637.1 hypothetical protein PF007_g3260 [Phytophthora fragariae]KAE9137453.1 hypothetical protein PF010_g1324 [Phytophthora fragariae]
MYPSRKRYWTLQYLRSSPVCSTSSTCDYVGGDLVDKQRVTSNAIAYRLNYLRLEFVEDAANILIARS